MKNITRFFWGSVLLLLAVAFGLWLAKYGIRVSDRYANHVGVIQKVAEAKPQVCEEVHVTMLKHEGVNYTSILIDDQLKDCNLELIHGEDVGKPAGTLVARLHWVTYCEKHPDELKCVCKINPEDARCLPEPEPVVEVQEEPVVEEPTCGASEKLVSGKCVPKEIVCDADQKLVNGKCIVQPPTCSADQELVKGKCVTKGPVCGEGKKFVESSCVAINVDVAPPKAQPCDAKINIKFDTGSLSMNATLFGQDLFSKLYEDATEEGEFGNAAMFRFCPAVKDKFGRADLRVDKKVDGELKMIWCSDDPEYCENVEFQVIGLDGKASEWRKLKEVKIDNDLYYGGVSRKMYHFY